MNQNAIDRTGRTMRPARRRLVLAAMLASSGLIGATPALAQSGQAGDLERRNRDLEAENARLRAALDHAGVAVTPTAAAPAVEADATTARAAAQSPDENRGDVVLGNAITVTGRRLREVTRSVSAVTGEELEKFQVNNFRDIASRIGNVRTSWNNPNTASVIVRGVGWAAGAGVLDPSVGVSVDDVGHGVSAISALSNYLDIETVEVLRGPTGSDGLRATNLGRVAITTRRPSFTPEARAAFTFGERNTLIGTAALGGTVIADLLAVRLTLNRETGDGPYKNANDTHYTWRNTDRTNARAQFLLTPSSSFEALVTADYTPTGREICENCFAFNTKTQPLYDWIDPTTGQRGRVDYANDAFGKLQRRWFLQKTDYTLDDYYARRINTLGEYPNTYATKGASANLRLKLGDDASIRSITAWRDYQFSQGAGSHTQFEWLRAPRGTQTSFDQFSQELRLDAQPVAGLTYRGGLFYYRGLFPNYSQTERYGSDAGAWYATATQYALLDPANPALPNATDPAGRGLLLNAADGLITQRKEHYDNRSAAFYSNLRWAATERLTFNIGARISRETRHSRAQSGILSDGFGAELNPAAVNNVTLSGFSSNAAGALTGTNNAAQLALADFVAQKYFGVATYRALTATQRAEVGAAKGIRAARIGALYQPTEAQAYRGTLPTIETGVAYRLADALTLVASYKHGEKPGIAQIVGATAVGGKSVPTRAEKTDAYELGARAFLFGKGLQVSATGFRQDIRDYIQPSYVYDAAQTALNGDGKLAYLSALGNVPEVRTQGVELDVALLAIPYTTIRFAGAYTDAYYVDFKFAANPGELGGSNPNGAYFDASGKTLAGAPKWSGNLFADLSYPLSAGSVAHANLNYNFQSGYYADTTLSRYTRTGFWGVTDLSIGLGRADGRFDAAFVVKNLFDVDTGLNPSWNQYKPGIPRWVGVQLRGSVF